MSISFKQNLENKNNLLIIDGLNLAFRWKHLGNREAWAASYLSTVKSFATSYKAKKVVVLSDAGSNYRKEIYPKYKFNREELRKNQTEEEATEFRDFLNEWKTAFALCATEFMTIQYNGVEADDIAAYIATRPCIRDSYNHIWLLSSDRDWDLLIDDKVSRFSYRTRKETTVENWETHYPYPPEYHISVKVLQGDKGDNVPGVEGIGEKRAAALIKEHGSALDIYSKLPLNDSRVFIQNLNKFKDQILLNYELMDLREFAEAAILEDNIEDLNSKVQDLCN